MIYTGLLTLNVDNENWLIIGAGAIGLLWYSKLADLKINVTLLHRNNQKLESLTVEDGNDVRHYPLQEQSDKILNSTFSRMATPTHNLFNRILFCTKSFDLISAYQENINKISHDAIILTLCNGMGAQQQLAKLINKTQTLFIGTTSEGALKLGVNQIKKTGSGDIHIGALDHSELPPKPFLSFYHADIGTKLYSKLAVNAVINPLTAFFDIKNGNLADDKFAPYYLACRDEVCRFLATKKLNQLELSGLIDLVVKNTSKNRSSMLQDFSSHRQTEIDYISGFLINEADKSQIQLPIQSFLHVCIKKRYDHNNKLDEFDKLITF